MLSLFSDTRSTLNITDVAREVDVSRTAARELLSSMVDIRLLRQVMPGRYGPGQAVARLLDTLLSSATLVRVAYPLMTDLHSSVRESLELVVNQGGVARVVDCITGNQPVSVRMSGVGTVRDPRQTATGKIVLAMANNVDQVDAYRRRSLSSSNFLAAVKGFHGEVKAIRARGIAYDRGEFIEGVCCFACPIFGNGGELLGAIGMATPTHRFNRTLTVAQPLLAGTAQAISSSMAALSAVR